MAPSMADYVAQNIDNAIKNGWIKAYYQPVVRSLTENLCGAESLARWIDPELGFLAPDKFIGALEESRQIHKLDLFILEQVCSDISERLLKRLPTVPVSVNFSRLDFEAVDMLKVVEDFVKKYDIPRDYLHIEVTESMIVSDSELMTRIIDNFRKTGYEVWMDDFGSGYSSLNLLKDYTFDTLKLDMAFLSNINEKSKSIMTSTITMAKDIKMMTLAEGVETAEQVEFLKSIGCGKLQGYYYGKPMPIGDFFEHIKEKNIPIEERKWRHFYDVASRNARATDQPLEIVEDDGKNFKTLFMNDAYKNQIFSRNYSSDEVDELIYNTPSPLLKKYREFADVMERSRNVETFYYTNAGNILRFVAQAVAELEGHFIIRGSIYNISMDQSLNKRNSVDSRLKELNHLFEQVIQINPSNNTVVPLLGRLQFGVEWEPGKTSLEELFDLIGREVISFADRARYHEMGDFATLAQRIEATGVGYIENILRMKQADGTLRWKVVYIMMIPGTLGKEFLVCVKNVPEYALDLFSRQKELFKAEDYGLDSSELDRYTRLFKNFVAYSSIKFFWKDNKRRYIGASNAFLEFFGIDSIDSIRGKTTDELNWAVDSKRCIDEENEIIQKGTSVKNVSAQYIINGIMHDTIYNKSPIYENGNIIGIMGYFIDIGDELDRMNSLYNIDKIDKVSGLMTLRAFVNAMIDYALEREKTGQDYGLIMLRHMNYERILSTYGSDFSDKVIREIADRILSLAGTSCAAARFKDDCFALITHAGDRQELDYLAEKVKEKIEQIKEVDGNSVTLSVRTSAVLRSGEGVTDENIYSVTFRGLE